MTARENFPVGSWLIRSDLRAEVAAFYRFARAADDVADDPGLPTEEKLRRLDRFEAGLDGGPSGVAEGLALGPVAARHARRLLRAFRRDARGGDCATWDDLMAYCADSANPVGRFLLDLHGEGARAAAASDALCSALQVLNHIQDLTDDHRRLGRHYLPAAWMGSEGWSALEGRAMTPALRRAVHLALDGCDALLDEADALSGLIGSRRLGGEAATILRLAKGLAARLRREDPLAARVAPSRADFAWAGLAGVAVALRPRRLLLGALRDGAA